MKNIINVLLLIETSREYGRSLIKGILEYCKLVPNWKIDLPAPFYVPQNSDAAYRKSIQQGLYDGIIGHIDKSEDFGLITSSKIPAVLQSIHAHMKSEIIHVNNDDIGRLGANFFIEKGFENYAFFGCRKLYFSNERYIAFRETLNSHPIHEYSTGLDIRPGRIKTDKIWHWLDRLPKPIGIMACNDDWAIILNEVCLQNKIKVPQEVAILGVDNDQIVCRTTWPYISSICLNSEKAGFEAAALLDTMMRTKRPAEKVISVRPTCIEERQSTDITITKDEAVSTALQFIKANIDKPIQVMDIVEHVLISRRSLQNKFNKHLGCPILDQIRRMQIERVAKLLVQTDISIANIANQSGFTSFANLSRIFKKYKDTSPSRYRYLYKL